MKILYLIRHAKSSWDNPLLSDFERPLNERGLRDAPIMGKRLAEKNIYPDLLISSPAVRTLTTARLLAAEIQYPGDKILEIKELYDASLTTFLRVLENLPDEYREVMIVAHNPTVSNVCMYLCHFQVELPTCAIVKISFPFFSWKMLSAGTGLLEWYDTPKNPEH
ncbi:MAG: histidine phosphatase family protein [Bacteroidia bacterium]|nr:histidine phosphatase family protein [Bacteroidia bacterium]